jgi:hypothetical protein
MGKVDTTTTSPNVPYNVETVSTNGSSTVAAVAAAQNADKADVNGKMAEFLAP